MHYLCEIFRLDQVLKPHDAARSGQKRIAEAMRRAHVIE